MRARISRRLRDRRGFSLGELMLTLAILLLVTGMLANIIPVAKDVMDRTVDAANARTLLSTTVTVLRDELSIAQRVEEKNDTEVYYISGKTGAKNKIFPGAAGESIQIQEYLDRDGLSLASDATRPLVSDAAATGELRTTYTGIAYNEANGVYEITGLQVVKNGNSVIGPMDLEIRNIQKKLAEGHH